VEKIGVIGLGNMGRGMALSLVKGGYIVLGFDVAGVSPGLREQGVQECATIAEIAGQADVLILSLPTSDIVEKVVLGEDGVAASGKRGAIVVDTTTADPNSTKRVAAVLAAAGIGFVDAPVSGGPKGAAMATMIMVLGGSPEHVAAVEPVLATISAKRTHVGPVGAGHVTKLLNNLLTGAHLLVASEAVRAAAALDIDPTKLIDALNGGSGRNSATLTNYPTWIFPETFDSGFTMKLMRKDMRLAMALLQSIDATAPIAREAGRLWEASEASIGDGEDFNRIVQYIDPQS